jgi:endonuclease YncB( thermonuclease family)
MLAGLYAKLGIAAVVGVICLICLAIIARNWSCRQPKPPRERSATYEVVSCPTGASVEVRVGRRRTAVVALDNIAAPAAGEPLADESRANLAVLAGTQIRVEWTRHGIFRGASVEQPPAAPPSADVSGDRDTGETAADFEARPPDSGVVYGSSGACCQQEQLAAGYAKLIDVTTAPKAWKTAETTARKAALGVWGKQ